MNEYISRFGCEYLARIETTESENLRLLRFYVSSTIGLVIIGLYKFYNAKKSVSWLTKNLLLGCFFLLSTYISARLSQAASEMKSEDFRDWFFMPIFLNCMMTLMFCKFANALEITFRDRRVYRNTKFITYCFIPSYSLISYYFKDEIEMVNYVDPFIMMKIIRIACLLFTIIALIKITTYGDCEDDERNVEKLVVYAGTTFMLNLTEGLFFWFLLKITSRYTCTCTTTTTLSYQQ